MKDDTRMEDRDLIHPFDGSIKKDVSSGSQLCRTDNVVGITICQPKNGTDARKKIFPFFMIFVGIILFVLVMSASITVTIDGSVTPFPPFLSLGISVTLIPISIGVGLLLGRAFKS